MKYLLNRIGDIFDIREGEAARSILMFFLIFFNVAALLIIKPVRNSLFLTQIGASNLPIAFLLVAIFSAGVVAIYSKYSVNVHIGRLTKSVLNLSILSLFLFWIVLHFELETKWIVYVFYVWVSIFGVVTTTQFWILSNYVFTSRQAKRLFGFVGAGGISGGIFGGYLTKFVADTIGTVNLLLISILFLLIALNLGKFAWVNFARKNYSERMLKMRSHRIAEVKKVPLFSVMKSKYLKYLAGLVGVSVLVAKIADYQFNLIVSDTIKNEDELTAFFGFWLSNLSIISLFIQLAITGRMLKTFGVGTSLLLLPFAIFGGAIALLINPGIMSALTIKVGDGAFKQSINKAAKELLSIPIAAEIKNKIKVFIDVFVNNLATGISGILLLVLSMGYGLSVAEISWVTIPLILVWLFIIFKIKKEYVNTFRIAIMNRSINLEDQQLNLNDASILENILPLLGGNNERQILYLLDLLEGVEEENMLPYLTKLLSHNSVEIRLKVLKMLQNFPSSGIDDMVLPLVEDNDLNIKINALTYLCNQSEDPKSFMREYVHSDNLEVKIAAMMCSASEYRNNPEFREKINIDDLFNLVFSKEAIEKSDPESIERMTVHAANFIGESLHEDLFPLLNEYIKNDSVKVKGMVIKNMGKTSSPQFVETLISYIDHRNLKSYARDALIGFGEDVLEVLVEKLTDENEEQSIRMAIPGILGTIYSDSYTHVLSKYLLTENRALRFEMIKSLNKLKVNFPDMKISSTNIQRAIMEELEYQYSLTAILELELALDKKDTSDSGSVTVRDARKLLIKSLSEKIKHSLEALFRLLGLKDASTDMYNAYLGIVGNNKNLKEDAIEFLDNFLSHKMKSYIVPLIEGKDRSSLARIAKQQFNIEIGTEENSIKLLISGSDNWLRVCAIFFASILDKEKYSTDIKRFRNDPDSVVRETVRLALAN